VKESLEFFDQETGEPSLTFHDDSRNLEVAVTIEDLEEDFFLNWAEATQLYFWLQSVLHKK